ncbi:hypothetical protein H4582DRAFT_2097737 [Lactarius indigo]|nr:hypothetical protein H4582DRAFT_2097737 [Lactarius indigo]
MHLVVYASQDWAYVDRVMVSNFVTTIQVQRKWYTNVLSKVSAARSARCNLANITVQNRVTGQLEEEKMQLYVRLGIRHYTRAPGQARKLLKSLSVKQGTKYDSPESVSNIPAFNQFHKFNVDEILEPLPSLHCQLTAFETISEATRLWIKGREFTIARLLRDAYKDQVERYAGGALVIFRLAPQVYHRFHSPVDGTVGPMTYIARVIFPSSCLQIYRFFPRRIPISSAIVRPSADRHRAVVSDILFRWIVLVLRSLSRVQMPPYSS